MASHKSVYTMDVGVATTVELLIDGARVSHPIAWPKVKGLDLIGTGYNPHENAFTFVLKPSHKGNFTVPAFDVRTDSGKKLHVGAMRFHAISPK
ncbi:MAG: hypothetical protein JOZ55_09875 [Alphaproteobacteria bacterium]|nr:hypothetical protein [Alphaproteobacteria bacterium]